MDNEDDEELQQCYYDDGNFGDVNDGNGELYDPSIPTYDELDLEGRYYNYGSRQDYNEWRNEQIRASHEVKPKSNYTPTRTDAQEAHGTIYGFIVLAIIVFLIYILY